LTPPLPEPLPPLPLPAPPLPLKTFPDPVPSVYAVAARKFVNPWLPFGF